jgi:hypothetical protein
VTPPPHIEPLLPVANMNLSFVSIFIGIKTGQLYKRATSDKNNWKKRYFLLSQPNLLQYYEDAKYKKIKNQIVLLGSMEIVRCSNEKIK